MGKIILATKNKGKVKEFVQLLAGMPVEVLSLNDLAGIPEIEETGSTFEENAALKAKTVAKITGLITVADDSGLEVDALGGAPGVYSARYAGEKADDAANNAKLLEALGPLPLSERTARFRSCIAIATPQGECYFAQGVCEGLIGFEPQGKQGFGYDPLFLIPEKNCTMAQLSLEEKNQISHRGKAFRKARAILAEILSIKDNYHKK